MNRRILLLATLSLPFAVSAQTPSPSPALPAVTT
jgi:hypothetical protein